MATIGAVMPVDSLATNAGEAFPCTYDWDSLVDKYFPAPHSRHVELEDAPDVAEYVPEEHRTQNVSSVFPCLWAYFPGPHARHVSLDDAPRADEYLPAAHDRHRAISLLPSLAAYVPIPQSRHVPAEAAPTDDEYLPATHAVQAADDVAPTEDEYFPAPQLVHSPLPTTALYLPSKQPTHVPFTPANPALHWQEARPDRLPELAEHSKHLPLPESDL